MSTGQRLGFIGVALGLAGLLAPRALEAQIGLGSGVGQVVLTARALPRASIQAVGPARETGPGGHMREATQSVRFSSNTGYRLLVRGAAAAGSEIRIWARAVDGSFQPLELGSVVTVAREGRGAGATEREVQFRVEMAGGESLNDLPVRYEIAVTPTL